MLIAQHFTTFLAAASPDATEIGKGVLTILVIVPVLSLAVAIIFGVLNTRNASRRNPPIGEEMHKVFVPRKEWDDSVQRIHVRIDQTRDVITASEASTGSKIDSLRTDMNKVFHDVERALGRVEGQLEEKKK